MRNVVLIFLVCCWLANGSCNHCATISSEVQLPVPFFDSLIKYDDTTAVLRVDGILNDSTKELQLLIATINGIRTAVINCPDSFLYVYKKAHGRWLFCDSFAGPSNYANSFVATDLNGDGCYDIRINQWVMRGNECNTVLLFNPKDSIFYHAPSFDQMNIGYDSLTGLVRSCGLGGNYDNSKTLYKIVADTLQLVQNIEMSVGNNPTGDIIYSTNNNGKIEERTLHFSTEKVYDVFDTALWDDKEDDMLYYYRATDSALFNMWRVP